MCVLYSLQVYAAFIFSKHMLLVIGYDVSKQYNIFEGKFYAFATGKRTSSKRSEYIFCLYFYI